MQGTRGGVQGARAPLALVALMGLAAVLGACSGSSSAAKPKIVENPGRVHFCQAFSDLTGYVTAHQAEGHGQAYWLSYSGFATRMAAATSGSLHSSLQLLAADSAARARQGLYNGPPAAKLAAASRAMQQHALDQCPELGADIRAALRQSLSGAPPPTAPNTLPPLVTTTTL